MSDETHDFTAMWSEAEPAEVMRLPDWLRSQVGPTDNPSWSTPMLIAAARLEALEAELAAERALADQLAEALQHSKPDRGGMLFVSHKVHRRQALAAHRAARTPQEKP